MPKISKTMSPGGAERARVEGSEAAQTGSGAVVVGPAATQADTLKANRVADELVDAGKAEIADRKKGDAKLTSNEERLADETHDLTKDEKAAASRSWNDDLDKALVRRETNEASVGPDRSADPVRVAAERDEETVAASRTAAATEDLRKGDERVAGDRTSLDLDESRRKDATRGQDHAAAEVEAQAASREQWLQAQRDEHQALAQLDDAALERVLDKTDNLANVRGQLVEELLHVELEERARAMGEGHEVFRGGTIQWCEGEDLTDGMIVRPVADEPGLYDVAAVAEAKAGELSARGLGEKHVELADLGREQRRLLEDWAIDVLRERLGATPENHQQGQWAHSDQLRATHRLEIQALMAELNSPDQTGQIRNDIERLMGHATEENVAENARAREPVTVLVNEEEKRLRVSPAQTTVLVATPSDVDVEQTRARLGEQGIRVETVDVGLTTNQVRELATELQQAQQRYEENALADRERAATATAERRQPGEGQTHGAGRGEERESDAAATQQAAHRAQQTLDEELARARELDRQRLDELQSFADALREIGDD